MVWFLILQNRPLFINFCTMKTNRTTVLFTFLLAFLPLLGIPILSQADQPEELERKLSDHVSEMAPQKIFLHTDKSNYLAGETIWFKAYLVNGITHQPDQSEANIHVEVWDFLGQKVLGLVLKPENGSANGEIELDAELPDGNYFILAYTDWMRNAGDDFLFRQDFYLENPGYANRIDNSSRRFNQNFNRDLERQQQQFSMGFFPEGGQLVNGVPTRVAVKLTDATGRGVQAGVGIKDSRGNSVGSFETNQAGLGIFVLEPEAGMQYSAEARIQGQRPVQANLPPALTEGFGLRVDIMDRETLQLTVHYASEQSSTGKCALLGHTRGQATFFLTDVGVSGSMTIRLPLSDFPTGITHFTLFSEDARPLAERLVFINHDDQAYFDMRVQALRTGDASAFNIDVLASDQMGIPLEGDFSVSVQFGNIAERSYRENIFSYLFLNSDLKGMVQDPALYFDYTQDSVEEAADLLMLTHGWRRFSWERVLSDNDPPMAHAPVYGTNLTGQLVNPDDDQGVRNAEVTLRLAEDRSKEFRTRTNDRGFFTFENLPFTDSVLVEVLPPVLAGRVVPHVEILDSGPGQDTDEELTYEYNVFTQPQQVTSRGGDWSRRRPDRSERTGGTQASAYGRPDQVIHVDQDQPYNSVIEILRDKAVGITVSRGGEITVRGPSSITHQGPPLFIIDGVESDGAFMSAHPRDLDRIEIFRGASTAAFGMRGAQGVFVAYTKRRDFESELGGQNMFLIAGLHAPREFYTDFEMPFPTMENHQVKTLLWEPELITNADGLANIQFLPVGGVTQYRIVIQGVSRNGKIGFGEFLIGN
jgi:hypothetical protein